MEYKIGQVFFDEELGANVRCVRDEVKNGVSQSCCCCIYSEDYLSGTSCPANGYNQHPCYNADRDDRVDVHFERVHKPIKPIALIKWLVDESIDTEGLATIEVDEEFDFETFFGYNPDEPVPCGLYLYIYSDCVLDADMSRLVTDEECKPYTITTQEKDRLNENDVTQIYLFKLED